MVGQGFPCTGRQAEPWPCLLATAHVEWFWLHTSSFLLSSQKLLLFICLAHPPPSVRPMSRGSISCWFLLVLWSAAASVVFPSPCAL